MNWKRSNGPVDLDALSIKMTVADQAHINGLVSVYPNLKLCQFRYPECNWEIIPWIKRYKPSDHLYDPFLDFESNVNHTTTHHYPNISLWVELVSQR
jgi:hypothetical protein